jgi:hypothetical protein
MNLSFSARLHANSALELFRLPAHKHSRRFLVEGHVFGVFALSSKKRIRACNFSKTKEIQSLFWLTQKEIEPFRST